jgi:hypothetical protein
VENFTPIKNNVPKPTEQMDYPLLITLLIADWLAVCVCAHSRLAPVP